MQPVLAVEVVEQVEEGASLGLQLRGQLEHREDRGHAVLVARDVRGHAVAQRLLVAECEVADLAEPLEAGEGLLPAPVVRLGLPAEHVGGDDRRAVGTVHAAAQQQLGQEHSRLVAREHPERLTVPDSHGASVGVRVVGDDDVGLDLRGKLQRQVHRARLLGVRERDGGEVGIGVALLAHDVQGREPGAAHDLDENVASDAVHRRVHGDDVARTVVREVDDSLHVGLGHVGAADGVVVAAGQLVDPADLVDERGDIGVGGRHDLAGVAEVDLVAVVLRRVVRRRHHDAGRAAEVQDRVGEHRRGQVLGQQVGAHARRLHDLGGVAGEHVGVVPRVVADDHGRLPVDLTAQVGGEPCGGLGDDDAVHPVRTAAEGAAQPGGAELQTGAEAVLERRGVVGVDEGLQLGSGLRVGVLADPVECEVDDGHGCSSGRGWPVRLRCGG